MKIISMKELVAEIIKLGVDLKIGPMGTFSDPDTLLIFEAIGRDVRVVMCIEFEQTIPTGEVIDPEGNTIELDEKDVSVLTWVCFKYDAREHEFSFHFEDDNGEVYDEHPNGTYRMRNNGYYWFDPDPIENEFNEEYPPCKGYMYVPSDEMSCRGGSLNEWTGLDMLGLVCGHIYKEWEEAIEPLQKKGQQQWAEESDEALFEGE